MSLNINPYIVALDGSAQDIDGKTIFFSFDASKAIFVRRDIVSSAAYPQAEHSTTSTYFLTGC
jgi:hypothetical protein